MKRLTVWWFQTKDGDADALRLYERHYSAYHYRDGRKRRLFIGPGEKLVLLSPGKDALLAWRKFISHNGRTVVNCCVFRNEGPFCSSRMLKDGMRIAWRRWPGARLYTYVNPGKIRSQNPGCCFKAAGWRTCVETQKGLLILEVTAVRSTPAP